MTYCVEGERPEQPPRAPGLTFVPGMFLAVLSSCHHKPYRAQAVYFGVGIPAYRQHRQFHL